MVRGRRHRWLDGALCTHAMRDRWDGRLVTALVYAVDYLVRQDYYELTRAWVGREIRPDGSFKPASPAGRRPTSRSMETESSSGILAISGLRFRQGLIASARPLWIEPGLRASTSSFQTFA